MAEGLLAAAAAAADGSSTAAELCSCEAACEQLLQLSTALVKADPVQLLLATDWQPLQQVLGDAASSSAGWAAQAAVLRGLEAFVSSCLPAEGREGGSGLLAVLLQQLPADMLLQLLQVLGSAGELRDRVWQDRRSSSSGAAARATAVQKRVAAVRDLLPRLHLLLQRALGRMVAVAEQQHEQQHEQQQQQQQAVEAFARNALHMSGAVLGVLLLPDEALGSYAMLMQHSAQTGLVGAAVWLLDSVVPAELEAGLYSSATEALNLLAAYCQQALDAGPTAVL
jgi:hypothetical protein